MKIAPTGEWLNDTAEGHCFDGSLAQAIIEFCRNMNLESVLDFGCGDGKYVQAINNCFELRAQGVDGNPNTRQLGGTHCWPATLHTVLENPTKLFYDLILSLEVGEHIPAEYEHIFLDNIVKFAKDWIILSWAVPGQGGDGHVNCKTNDEIVSLMLDRGFKVREDLGFYIRQSSKLPWFKDTLMIFKRKI